MSSPFHLQRPLSLHVGLSWATEGAGGSGRVFADLAKYLPDQGIGFLGAVAAPPDVEESTQGVVRNLAAPGASGAARLWQSRRTLERLLKENRPELLASHFALLVFPVLDQLRRQRHVVHFHGPWSAESEAEGAGRWTARAKHAVETVVYRRADRVIVLSDAFRTVAVRDYGIPATRIRIVPGAVDLQRFAISQSRAEARGLLFSQGDGLALHQGLGDRKLLICVRRLVNRMGLTNLIAAIAQVRATVPEVLLLIAGKGRLRAPLEAQVTELGLGEHVRLLGFVPDAQLPLLYRAADLNVVPTQSLEGFGLVAAEALAAGTPSMVTPVGGLPEVVQPLSSSLVFSGADADAIAEGIRAALTGALPLPSETECRDYACHHFSAERMARDTAEVYRELLG